eukprot:1142527-Pelagomonas_calceolata.AAC.5
MSAAVYAPQAAASLDIKQQVEQQVMDRLAVAACAVMTSACASLPLTHEHAYRALKILNNAFCTSKLTSNEEGSSSSVAALLCSDKLEEQKCMYMHKVLDSLQHRSKAPTSAPAPKPNCMSDSIDSTALAAVGAAVQMSRSLHGRGKLQCLQQWQAKLLSLGHS